MNKWPKSDKGPGSDEVLVQGKQFVDHGYMSTCANKDKTAAASFKVTLVGVKNGVDISKYSAQPGEAEVLIPAGTKFKITEMGGGKITRRRSNSDLVRRGPDPDRCHGARGRATMAGCGEPG